MTDEIDDWYVQEYNEAFRELKEELSTDEYNEIMKELVSNFNQKHTDNPTQDAQKNFIRAQNAVRGGGGLGDDVNSFIDYIAKTDGKPRAEVRAWAKEALRKEPSPRHSRHSRY